MKSLHFTFSFDSYCACYNISFFTLFMKNRVRSFPVIWGGGGGGGLQKRRGFCGQGGDLP
jgi:hypothetical protein